MSKCILFLREACQDHWSANVIIGSTLYKGFQLYMMKGYIDFFYINYSCVGFTNSFWDQSLMEGRRFINSNSPLHQIAKFVYVFLQWSIEGIFNYLFFFIHILSVNFHFHFACHSKLRDLESALTKRSLIFILRDVL